MRLAGPVVASLALHLALVLWALALDKPEWTAPKQTAVVVDIRWEEPPPPPPPPPPPAPEPKAPAPAQRKKGTGNISAERAPSEEPKSSLSPDAPIAESPTAARPSLLLSSDFKVAAVDAGFEPGSLAQTGKPRDGQALIAGIARDTIGRGKVDRGLVHPYFAELGKALLKNWDVDRAAKETGLKGLAQGMAKNVQTMNSIWLERAAIFARTGSPLDAPTTRGVMVPTNTMPGANLLPGQVDPQARKEMGKVIGEAFSAVRRATLRVVQGRDGRLIDVAIIEPSNDLNVDREAVVDVRAAAAALPVPPPEAIGNKETFASLWNFELIVSISPPIPTITFEFDEAIGFIDARLPLDRRIYKKVKLVSVETD